MTIGGIAFSTWDQWFLLLVFGEHDGDWSALRDRLRARRRGLGFEQHDAEAKPSHLDDLERRWAPLSDLIRESLRRECSDHRLVRRARAKILERLVDDRDKTPPMRATPRVRLRERALRGHWSRFPVSPARHERTFRAVLESRDFYGERATFGLARRLDAQLTRELNRVTSPAEQVAVLRAFVTSLLLAMERADDSCGILADLARHHFPKYFTAPWREAGLSPELFYRDFIEYAVWEDYGRLGPKELEPFFKTVQKADVMFIDGLLRELRAELGAAELEYQAEEALTLLGALHVKKQTFNVLEHLVRDKGSRHWERITSLAVSALAAGHREIATAVFAAADQPSFHRDYLRQCSRQLLVPRAVRRARRPHLSIVR